jgi:hypothetical protein
MQEKGTYRKVVEDLRAKVFEDLDFHERAVRIVSLFQNDGWKEFEKVIDRTIESLLDKIGRDSSGVEVGAVDKKGQNITIVVLNSSELQHELKFWRKLKKQFVVWQEEAARKPEE